MFDRPCFYLSVLRNVIRAEHRDAQAGKRCFYSNDEKEKKPQQNKTSDVNHAVLCDKRNANGNGTFIPICKCF